MAREAVPAVAVPSPFEGPAPRGRSPRRIESMDVREILVSWLDDYRERMGRLRFADLARRQEGRFASLSDGAAGVAWAHLHVARTLGDDGWLEGAERWARLAWRHRDDGRAFFPAAEGPRRHLAGGAFLFGRVGVVAVRALAAAARGEAAALDRALADFAAACRPASESSGLFAGTAGALAAAALLLEATGDRRLLPVGRRLAGRLARQAAPLDGRPVAWRAHPGPGLAHGAAGILLALVGWHRAAGPALPPPARQAVDRLLAEALDDPRRFCARPTFVASACNGFAGLAALALAVAETADELDLARRAARHALAALPPRPDVCCGRGGAAAVCLALDGLDPAGPWRRRAEELVLSALLVASEDWETVGLYSGEAGLACLVADLRSGGAAGLPGLSLPRPLGDPLRPAVAACPRGPSPGRAASPDREEQASGMRRTRTARDAGAAGGGP